MTHPGTRVPKDSYRATHTHAPTQTAVSRQHRTIFVPRTSQNILLVLNQQKKQKKTAAERKKEKTDTDKQTQQGDTHGTHGLACVETKLKTCLDTHILRKP